jgi:sigma-B regulation protein RsbU (phosphoserine phosphatase)
MPSSRIGGDFYNVRLVRPGLATILLADAAGHGVSAALLAAMMKLALDQTLLAEVRPSAVLSELNRQFQFCAEQGEYISAFFATLDCASGSLLYSLAGQVHPLLYRFARNEVQELNTPGFCLGVFEEGGYEDRQAQIAEGDRLLMFTDGLTEATSDGQENFGQRLPEFLQAHKHLSNEEFLMKLDAAVKKFVDSPSLSDDCTILALHHPSGSAGSLQPAAGSWQLKE